MAITAARMCKAGPSQNILWAERAVAYVKSKMTEGASNKPKDVLRSFGVSLICVVAQRSVTNADDAFYANTDHWITTLAYAAENTGCGNCGEQSALAFHWLREQRVRPLDYMQFTNRDHAFVVIGRPSNSRPADIKTWKSSVVCDAWIGKAYPAAELGNHWRGGIPASVFRLE